MISNNLKNVSRGARKPHRYAAHCSRNKGNTFTVPHALFSGTITRASTDHSRKSSSHSTVSVSTISPIRIQSKSCSSTQQIHRSNDVLSDLIPKLPSKIAKDLTKIENHLANSGQNELIQFLSHRLQSNPDRIPLDQSTVTFLLDNAKNNRVGRPSMTHVSLHVIQASAFKSIAVAQKQMESLKSTKSTDKTRSTIEMLQHIIDRAKSTNKDNDLYFGWISVSEIRSSKANPPSMSKSFVKALKVKPTSIVMASLDTALSKQTRSFKEVLIYSLALDAKHGGLHDIPKWVDSDIMEEEPQSSSTIAKSTGQSVSVSHSEMSWDDPDDMIEEEEDLLPEVERIQLNFKRTAEKHTVRAKHLQKWNDSLTQKEKTVGEHMEDIKRREADIQQHQQSIFQKEQELTEQQKSLNALQHSNQQTASELEQQRREISESQKRIHQQSADIERELKALEQRKQSLDEKAGELDAMTRSIAEREATLQNGRRVLDEEKKSLQDERERLKRDIAALNTKQTEISKLDRQSREQSVQIRGERQKLDKDQAAWKEKEEGFQQRDEELTQREEKYQEQMGNLTKMSKQVKEGNEALKMNQEINRSKASDLETQQKMLNARISVLEERETTFQQIESKIVERQKALQTERHELMSRQNTFNIQSHEYKNKVAKFKDDQSQFIADKEALHKQRMEYERNMTQLEEDQKALEKRDRFVETQQSKIDSEKEVLNALSKRLEVSKQESDKDRADITVKQQELKEMEQTLKERKSKLDHDQKAVDEQLADLKAQRVELTLQQEKNREWEVDLGAKKERLEVLTEQTEAKQRDNVIKSNALSRQEQALNAKAGPMEQKEKELTKKEDVLNTKEKMISRQERELFQQREKQQALEQRLSQQSEVISSKEKELDLWSQQIEDKSHRIAQQDRRITEKLDTFNKEKYEITKLEQAVNAKEEDISRREQDIKSHREQLVATQRETEQDKERISERRRELTDLEREFKSRQSALEIQEQSQQQNLVQFQADQKKHEVSLREYEADKKKLESDRVALKSQEVSIREKADYIKQQNQSIQIQMKQMEEERKRVDSKLKLLASRSEQVMHEMQAQTLTQSKLVKIKNELQSAQKKHELENAKMSERAHELQIEERRLSELKEQVMAQSRELEQSQSAWKEQEETLKRNLADYNAKYESITAKEHELRQREISLEKQGTTLKVEVQAQEERESVIQSLKDRLESDQHVLSAKEKELERTRQEVDRLKNDLLVKTAKKESEITVKATALTERAVMIEKMERKVQEQEYRLKRYESSLDSKQNEIQSVQTELEQKRSDLESKREALNRSISEKEKEIEIERRNIESEKEVISRQKMESKQIETQQIDALKSENDLIRRQLNELEMSTQRVQNENEELIVEKRDLSVRIKEMAKKDRSTFQSQQLALRQQQIANEKLAEQSKHQMTALKRTELAIQSREEKVIQRERALTQREHEQMEKEKDVEQFGVHLQVQLERSQKQQEAAQIAERQHEEGMKKVSGVQQILRDTQQGAVHKDILIQRLQTENKYLKTRNVKEETARSEKEVQIALLEDEVVANLKEIQKLQSELIELKSIPTPTQQTVTTEVTESTAKLEPVIVEKVVTVTVPVLPPNDVIFTKDVASVPLAAAIPMTSVSKRNVEVTSSVRVASIPINDPLITSKSVVPSPVVDDPVMKDSVLIHPTESYRVDIDSLPPKDTIPTQSVDSVSVSAAEPISMISKRNKSKISYIPSESIGINDPLSTSMNVVEAPQSSTLTDSVLSRPSESDIISVDSLPPRDTVHTASLPSVPLYAALPTSRISKRNGPKLNVVDVSSISINDPASTSRSVIPTPTASVDTKQSVLRHPMESGVVTIDSLPPSDTISTQNVKSVPLSSSESTSTISRRNRPFPGKVLAQSIGINDSETTSQHIQKPVDSTMTSPEERVASVPFEPAAPITPISRHNVPEKGTDVQVQGLQINALKPPTFGLLSTPQQRVMDLEGEEDELPRKMKEKMKTKPTFTASPTPQDVSKDMPKEAPPRTYKPYKPQKPRTPSTEKTEKESRTFEVEAFVESFEPPKLTEVTESDGKPADVLSHPTESTAMSIDSLPPRDTIYTAKVQSVPLSAAPPTSVVSKRNQSRIKAVNASSIEINDPQMTSQTVVATPAASVEAKEDVLIHPTESYRFDIDSLPPKDTIPTQSVDSVSLSAAEPTSMISKRNKSKISYIPSESIGINDPLSTSMNVVEAPQSSTLTDSVLSRPSESGIISVDSLPPRDTVHTANLPSVPLYAALPTSRISKRNGPKLNPVNVAWIAINDVTATSRDVVPVPSATTALPTDSVLTDSVLSHPATTTEVTHVDSLPPSDVIATTNVPSVPLAGAPPISMLSRFNESKLPWFQVADSIPINIPTKEDFENLLCHPIGLSSEVGTSIAEAMDILFHPSLQSKGINMEGFKAGIDGLRSKTEKLDDLKETAEESADPTITEFEAMEPELESALIVSDLEALFQCSTNEDLLFDDMGHLEEMLLGLDPEIQECLSDCRAYKSMLNTLPSTFKSSIADLNASEEALICTGDVVCCLQWQFSSDEVDTLKDVMTKLVAECDASIQGNRELMEQYKLAMADDSKRSVSNRNKLRPSKKMRNAKAKKMSILEINANGFVDFKNDLNAELMELQYANAEWSVLKNMLMKWMENMDKAMEMDDAAVRSADIVYMRSFCVLPSQSESVRMEIVGDSDHLDQELRNRRWVKELNRLLTENALSTSLSDKFEIYYSEMGPDVASWDDKLLCRELTAYLLNGTSFELNTETSPSVPLSEGFVRIGYQSQLLLESAQSLLGHIDPFIEQIVSKIGEWTKKDHKVMNGANAKNLENSLQNGQALHQIDPSILNKKTPLERAKMLEKDEKYVSLFREPLSVDLDELRSHSESRPIDREWMAKLHSFLSRYFQKLYRDRLMLPTPNSAIVEETALESWQQHALLEAVCSEDFAKLLQLLGNEKVTKQIARFASHDVFSPHRQSSTEQQAEEDRMFHELFAPFAAFREYHRRQIMDKMVAVMSDFDLQQFLSENVYQTALSNKVEAVNGQREERDMKWAEMSFTEKMVAPQGFVRSDASSAVGTGELPVFTEEERLATYWSGFLKGVFYGVPVERPIRLPEHYHDLEMGEENEAGHLKQHYFVDSFKPPSSEDVAPRISTEDRMNGVDIYRDQYIQRPHQSKRMLQSQIKFLYHNKLDYMRGAFPLDSFNDLPYGTDKPIKHRVTVRKSPFVHWRAQENYESRIYTKIATNYKLTSNRTADMFNARGFDIIYESVRVM